MRFRFLIIALLFVLPGLAQEKQEKMSWDENRPLTWEDFKGEAPKDRAYKFQANSSTGIAYDWYYGHKNGEPILRYSVTSNFYPNLSWVRNPEDKVYLLAHEQLHFDISELHARKLRKAMDEYEIGRNIRRDLLRLYNTIEKERQEMQKAFDVETHNGMYKDVESRWRNFIAEELKKLEQYKN
ncbi:DUF922 domain-containing protein [Salegentibacter chungangensis]|uniref:DUF922 domain-containing protein n=1 Tax=Salegentibacter chungangensis TaxID=1335724 RepID=A0ABW3NSN7_9FLAO